MAHFTLKQLEIFIAVADHLSISYAARALHLSQPAISQQIRRMEIYSGKTLFEQIGRKIYLSESGRQLLVHARNVMEQAELFKLAAINNEKIISGTLKLGIGIPLQAIFFNSLSKFMRQYSHVNFEFMDGDRNNQLHYLKENKIDFCLVVHPVNKLNFTSEKVTELPMTFIMSPQHHLANKRHVRLQMLLDETFIACDEGTANYHQLFELFKKLNKSPKLIQIKDQNAVKHAVMANLGISVLPKNMLQLEFKNNMLIPLIIDECTNPLTAAYWIQHADKKISHLTQSFKIFLFNEFRDNK